MPKTPMQEQQQPQNMQQHGYFNEGFQDFSALRLRLDTYELHQRIETYLHGKRMVISYDEQGMPKEEFEAVGKEKANKEGIQMIMAIVTGVINPQTVQGNFKRNEFEDFMYDFHSSLNKNLIANCEDWKIKDKDINPMIDFIMHLVRPFMSRTIDNEERKGYGQTRMYESVLSDKKKGGFRMPTMGK